MRLGQLARELEMKPTEIANFLRKEMQIDIELDPNFRVEEKYIELLKSSKQEPTESDIEEKVENLTSEEASQVKEVETKVEKEEPSDLQKIVERNLKFEEKKKPIKPKKKIITLEEKAEYEVDLSADVIRAPKVDIGEGVKVLGKIELPEKKTEEEKQAEKTEEQLQKEAERAAEREEKRKKREEYLAEKERRKEQAIERKKRQERQKKQQEEKKKAAKLKEQKRKNYLESQEKYKPSSTSTKKKKKQKTIDKEAVSSIPKREKPKSFFGKIWYWLNT